MSLWKKILINSLQNETDNDDFTNDETLKNLVESQCYQILQSIVLIIDDTNLSDEDCFDKIEKIIQLLEHSDIYTDRHDFG